MASPPRSSSSSSPTLSLLIIFFLLAFVIVITLSIHLLIRLLSRRLRPATTSSLTDTNSTSSSSSTSVTSTATTTSSQNASLINSLPFITLSVLPNRSPVDCAVCLSRFRHDDKLRMLPACRHAFHSACIDRWLRSTPSCPLCRSSVGCQPPLPPSPPPTAAAAVLVLEEEATNNIGMWLKEYVDRLASAASTPFSSMRWGSGRRFAEGEGGATDDVGSVTLDIDWEEIFRSSESGGSDSGSAAGYFASSYKWMMAGAVP